jgi:CBS domain-containing protein
LQYPLSLPLNIFFRKNIAMNSIRAEDIMIPLDSYPHVPYWFSLRQAIAVMEKSQFEIEGRQSLPRVILVFDEKYQLMGMVRRRDILRGLVPDAMQESIERKGESDPAHKRDTRQTGVPVHDITDEISTRAERPIRDVIAPIRVTLPSDTPIIDIATALVINNVSFVPITKNGKVSGVIRSNDVLLRLRRIII